MSRTLYMTGGPFGPMRTQSGQFSKPANPYVATHVRFGVGQTVNSQQPVSMTLAGQPESCCSGCAQDKRAGH